MTISTIAFYVARARLSGAAAVPGHGRKRKYAGAYARRFDIADFRPMHTHRTLVPGETAFLPELDSLTRPGSLRTFRVDAVGREGARVVAHVS